MKFAFTSKFKAIKNSCSKLVIASAVGWEAQLRRMRNCRVFLNDGVGVLLFVSASKGEEWLEFINKTLEGRLLII